MMASKQIQIFESSKMTLEEAKVETIASLNEYGSRFPHWVVTFSGGKDSTALVTLIAWSIKTKQIKNPQSIKVLMSDTKIEIVPLQLGAIELLSELQKDGFETQIVEPKLDDRIFVAILGRGLPPPNNGRRSCTRMLKLDPMTRAIKTLKSIQPIQETLFLTGLRLGESRARDERIAVACSKESGECGQGFYQNALNDFGYASLSPIVHWRVCNVFDWLYFEQDKHGYSVNGILEVYGDDDLRTGCMACFAVEKDKPTIKLSKTPKWKHLGIVLELKELYEWLNRHENRLRKPLSYNKDGSLNLKSDFVGPLTMEARKKGLEIVLDIQLRSGITLINDEELARIYWHWENNTWPKGWTGSEPNASELVPIIKILVNKKTKEKLEVVTQDTLFNEH